MPNSTLESRMPGERPFRGDLPLLGGVMLFVLTAVFQVFGRPQAVALAAQPSADRPQPALDNVVSIKKGI
jgi:hypothetical protein